MTGFEPATPHPMRARYQAAPHRRFKLLKNNISRPFTQIKSKYYILIE